MNLSEINTQPWGKILGKWYKCQVCRYCYYKDISLENCPNCYDAKINKTNFFSYMGGIEADKLQESYQKYIGGNKDEVVNIIKNYVNTISHLTREFLENGSFKAYNRNVPEEEWLAFIEKVRRENPVPAFAEVYAFSKEIRNSLIKSGNSMKFTRSLAEKCYLYIFPLTEILIILNNQYNVENKNKNSRITILIH